MVKVISTETKIQIAFIKADGMGFYLHTLMNGCQRRGGRGILSVYSFNCIAQKDFSISSLQKFWNLETSTNNIGKALQLQE